MGLIRSTCAGHRVSSLCAHARLVTSVVSDCDARNCSPPASSVGGSLQARILGWLAFPPPGDLPDHVIEPTPPGRFFTTEPPGKCEVAVDDAFTLPGAVTASKQAKHSGCGRTHGHLHGPSFKDRLAPSRSMYSATSLSEEASSSEQRAEFLRPGPLGS